MPCYGYYVTVATKLLCHTVAVQCKVSPGSSSGWLDTTTTGGTTTSTTTAAASSSSSGWLDRFNSREGFTALRWVSTKLGFPKNSSSCSFFIS